MPSTADFRLSPNSSIGYGRQQFTFGQLEMGDKFVYSPSAEDRQQPFVGSAHVLVKYSAASACNSDGDDFRFEPHTPVIQLIGLG